MANIRADHYFTYPSPIWSGTHAKGFPQGKLGSQLALIYEVKRNGLEAMLEHFLKDNNSRQRP